MIKTVSILGLALLVTSVSAQIRSSQPSACLDFALTYNATHSNTTTTNVFWLQGGSAQLHARFYHGLGVEADLAGQHGSYGDSSNVGLDVVTATFGPRYTLSQERVSVFGHGLLGVANGFHSAFPRPSGAQSSSNSLAVQAGGGLDFGVSRRLGLRLIQADWLRTQFPNSTTNVQNNFTLSAGVVFHVY